MQPGNIIALTGYGFAYISTVVLFTGLLFPYTKYYTGYISKLLTRHPKLPPLFSSSRLTKILFYRESDQTLMMFWYL